MEKKTPKEHSWHQGLLFIYHVCFVQLSISEPTSHKFDNGLAGRAQVRNSLAAYSKWQIMKLREGKENKAHNNDAPCSLQHICNRQYRSNCTSMYAIYMQVSYRSLTHYNQNYKRLSTPTLRARQSSWLGTVMTIFNRGLKLATNLKVWVSHSLLTSTGPNCKFSGGCKRKTNKQTDTFLS